VPFESPRLTEILYQPKRHAEKAFWVLRDTWRRRESLARAREFDAVVLYREATIAGPPIYERLLARKRIPMFLDFDDAIWLDATSDGGPNGFFGRLRLASWKTASICRMSRGIIVGNGYLESYAREHNSNVHVVPTTIDLSRYPLRPLPADDPFVVGWSGSLHTLVHLESARPALERLAERRKIEVHVVCNAPPPPFKGAENTFTKWSESTEVDGLARAHVGIMPLPDTPHTRGKCALKALIVRDGENGMLAATTEQWVEALERLADSPDLRARLAAAGRTTVETEYSSTVGAAKFAAAVRESLEGRARAGAPFAERHAS
jgi:glycosyltransferase involved in cell wall biosynthesis